MLHTNNNWESVDGAGLLREITNQPGLRQYVCVEIPINVQIFHLDIRSNSLNEKKWSRYIFDDIRSILPILYAMKNELARVSLQTRRIDHKDYKIIAIKKIVAGITSYGVENYAFICADGERYYESIADVTSGKFEKERIIWSINA